MIARVRSGSLVRAVALAGMICALALMAAPGAWAGSQIPRQAAQEESAPAWMVQPAGELGGADVRSYFVYDLAPGEWVEDVVAIVNHSEAPLTLSVFGTDAFTGSDSGAFGLLDTGDEPRDVGAWVTLPEQEVTVPARSTMQIPFLVTVPANATPGDHVGGIVTSYVTSLTDESGRELDVDSRIAIRIYLAVDGELEPRLAVDGLQTSYRLSPNGITGDLTVSYLVRNSGNVRLGTAEQIQVAGPFGTASTSRSDALEEVLPGGVVMRSAVLSGVRATGWVDVEVIATGVDLTDRLDGQVPVGEASDRVIALPWWWLLIAVVLVTVIWLFVRRRRRRWAALKAELAQARANSAGPVDPPSTCPAADDAVAIDGSEGAGPEAGADTTAAAGASPAPGSGGS